jgi:hypothetical protein
LYGNFRLPLGKSVLDINNWFIQYRSILANKSQTPYGIAFHMLLNLDEEIKKKEKEPKKTKSPNGEESSSEDEDGKNVIDDVLDCLTKINIFSALDLSLHKERDALLKNLTKIFDGSGNADLKNLSKTLEVLFNAFPPIMEDVVVYSHEGFYSNEVSVVEVNETPEDNSISILTSMQVKRTFRAKQLTEIYDNIEMYVGRDNIRLLGATESFTSETVLKNRQGIFMVKYVKPKKSTDIEEENKHESREGWIQYSSLEEDDKSEPKPDEFGVLLNKRVLEIVPLVNTAGMSTA